MCPNPPTHIGKVACHQLESPISTFNIEVAVVAMCVEYPVYMQAEQDGMSLILGTDTQFSHDLTSLSVKFVT